MLTLLCWLVLLGSFFAIPYTIGYSIAEFPDRPDAARGWLGILLLGISIGWMCLGPLSAFYMLKAKNWARWLVVTMVVLELAAAIMFILNGVPFPIGQAVHAALTVPLVLIIVFLPESNRYFAARGRPRWQLDEEEDRA